MNFFVNIAMKVDSVLVSIFAIILLGIYNSTIKQSAQEAFK